MTSNTKRKSLILFGLVTVIIMIIAASLSRLELKPGMPLPSLQGGHVVAAPIEKEPAMAISINKFVVMLFVLILAGSMLYAIYKLLRGADWKSLISIVKSMLIISLIVTGLMFLIMLLPKSGSAAPMEIPVGTPTPLVTSPLGEVPSLLLWLVGIGLLAICVLVGAWILKPSRPGPIDMVELEAEKAWQALRTGADLKDVIFRCYRQMSRALEQEKGIERKDFMTTGEFETLLKTAGLPYDPIHQLTLLFEAVRYGNWQPNSKDEQKAVQCLESIISYSRETKGKTLK
jgi:hypothetical protein